MDWEAWEVAAVDVVVDGSLQKPPVTRHPSPVFPLSCFVQDHSPQWPSGENSACNYAVLCPRPAPATCVLPARGDTSATRQRRGEPEGLPTRVGGIPEQRMTFGRCRRGGRRHGDASPPPRKLPTVISRRRSPARSESTPGGFGIALLY